jgi:hypothetical protein
MKMKKYFFLIVGISALVVLLSQILFFKQAEFLDTYDASYWKDRFDHSQWSLPLSRRTLGDDGIYAYGGYRLMQGASIEETNTNKPPVGIYLIGASILLFQNPNTIIFLIGILSLVVFYCILINFIKDKSVAVLSVALLAVNPMFFTHTWLPLIDLIQTFFLLVHVLAFIYLFKYDKYRLLSALVGGISLGLFTETKPPILLPIIIALEGGYLIYKKMFKEIIMMAVGFGIALVIPYFRYFLNGHNIVDYVRLHKYMASIYYEGKNEVFRTGLAQAILLGRFPDVSSGVATKFADWWIALPLIFIGSIISVIGVLRTNKKDLILKGIGVLILLTLIIFSNVSSYPRYLLIILPFVILFFALFLLDYLKPWKAKSVLSILVVVGVVNAFFFLKPTPDDNLNRFYYNHGNQLFQDIYVENLTTSKTTSLSQEQFRQTLLRSFHNANIRYVTFKEKSRVLSEKDGTGHVTVVATYFTQDVGTFVEEKTIQLKKEQEEWKIVWDWNLALNQYRPEYTFETNVINGSRGTIYDSEKNVLVQDTDGYLISIDPSKIDKNGEEKMLDYMEKVTKLSRPAIHNNYTQNPITGIIYPIATTFAPITEPEIEKLETFPGVIVEYHQARIYYSLDQEMIENTIDLKCCTRIYSPYSYHGVEGIESEKDAELAGYNGGTLVMKDENGKIVRTLIDRKPKNGKDVIYLEK